MLSLVVTEQAVLDGRQFNNSETVQADHSLQIVTSVPAAKVGQLTTRTDADTGTLTMSASHGITTGARLDVYWTGGSRRGMTVGTVSGNSVPIDGGSGDNLPTNLTAITAAVPVEEDLVVTGDNVAAIALYSDQAGTIVLAESDDGEALGKTVGSTTNAGKSWIWTPSRDATNPVASADITKAFLSHGSSTAVAEMRIAILFE